MKNTITEIIDEYGAVKLHYLVIVFGDRAETMISFRDQSLNARDLKSYIYRIRRSRGGPRLDKALEEAKKAFEKVPRRPKGKRILVILIDNKSIGDSDDMKKLKAAKELNAEGVRIIPVAIGNEADPGELKKVTALKENFLLEPKKFNPKELAKKIMKKAFGGEKRSIKISEIWKHE